MYQQVTIIGNLGTSPELKFMPNGDAVCSFSVATNRTWKNPDGSKAEEVTWYRVTAWRKLGEVCNQYLTKGRQVFINGRLTPDKNTGGPRVWTGNDGQPHASFELTALEVKFLGGGGGARDGGDTENGGFSDHVPSSNDEIPF